MHLFHNILMGYFEIKAIWLLHQRTPLKWLMEKQLEML